MGWATSEQVLETLANDVPEAYKERAFRARSFAVMFGANTTIASALATVFTAAVANNVNQGNGVSMINMVHLGVTGLNLYLATNILNIATKEATRAKQLLELAKKAGESKTTYFVNKGFFRRQLLPEEEPLATEVTPYNCVSSIPEGKLGAVNAVKFNYLANDSQDTNKKWFVYKPFVGDTEGALFLTPQTLYLGGSIDLSGRGFVVAERKDGKLYAKMALPAIDSDSYYKSKRKLIRAKERNDLVWVPVPSNT